jgi:hypothetical protein
MEAKLKHLELIQAVINRLSTNSFLLKGWSVVLISALFALAAPESRPAFVYVAYIPAIVLWGLDGYFLWQERLYRALYDHVRSRPDNEVDFSMDASGFRSCPGRSWPAATLSRTLLIFYGILVLAVIVVMVITLRNEG